MEPTKLQHLKRLAYERRFPAGLVRADAINIPLQDGTVDLIVTSPPYFALRSYTDGGEHYDGQIGSEATPQDFLDALWAVTRECARVLKPTGSLWVNLGDKYSGSSGQNNNSSSGSTLNIGPNPERTRTVATKAAPVKVTSSIPAKSLMGLPWRYAIGCIDDLGLILRAEVIWSKPNGLPESVTDRVRRSHEQWFHFTKSPRYFAAVDEVREPHAPGTAERYAAGYGDRSAISRPHHPRGCTNTARTSTGYDLGGEWTANPLGKLPGSVWTIPSEPLKVPDSLCVDHFAAYPQEWPRRIILGWSPPDGVVLDPFGGTGTTAMVARALGRYPVHLDLSADYLRLAQWRIFRSCHDHKTIERTNEQHPDRPLAKRQLRPKDLKAAKKAGMEYG